MRCDLPIREAHSKSDSLFALRSLSSGSLVLGTTSGNPYDDKAGGDTSSSLGGKLFHLGSVRPRAPVVGVQFDSMECIHSRACLPRANKPYTERSDMGFIGKVTDSICCTSNLQLLYSTGSPTKEAEEDVVYHDLISGRIRLGIINFYPTKSREWNDVLL